MHKALVSPEDITEMLLLNKMRWKPICFHEIILLYTLHIACVVIYKPIEYIDCKISFGTFTRKFNIFI